jgi:hypothetical protein
MCARRTYSQPTGALADVEGTVISHGSAGHGPGLDAPALQSVHDIGPLLQGSQPSPETVT